MAYTPISFSAFQTLTAAQMNVLAANDAFFKADYDARELAWASWTPTWTNLTVGSGTVTAKYKQIGKTIHFYVRFVYGSGSSVSNDPRFTLPVTVSSTFYADTSAGSRLWPAHIEDNGTQTYFGVTSLYSTSSMRLLVLNVASTYLQNSQVTSTVPMTWTSGDSFTVTGTYEAA